MQLSRASRSEALPIYSCHAVVMRRHQAVKSHRPAPASCLQSQELVWFCFCSVFIHRHTQALRAYSAHRQRHVSSICDSCLRSFKCSFPNPHLGILGSVLATCLSSCCSTSLRRRRVAKKLRHCCQGTTPARTPLAIMRWGVSCMSANVRATCWNTGSRAPSLVLIADSNPGWASVLSWRILGSILHEVHEQIASVNSHTRNVLLSSYVAVLLSPPPAPLESWRLVEG